MVVDPHLEHELSDRVEVGGHRAVVAVGDLDGIGKDRPAPLEIHKPRGPLEGEAHLLRVEQVEYTHVVSTEPEVAEGAGEFRRVDEQVGDDHHECPLPDRLGQFMEHVRQLGSALRAGLLDDVEDLPQVGRAAARREGPHDFGGRAGDADGVSLLTGEVAERPADPSGVVDLGKRLGARGRLGRGEAHRPARVEHDHEPEVRVGLVLLDIETIGAAEGPPVEPPQVVAGDILAILGKLDARAAMGAGMPTRHPSHHRLAGQ